MCFGYAERKGLHLSFSYLFSSALLVVGALLGPPIWRLYYILYYIIYQQRRDMKYGLMATLLEGGISVGTQLPPLSYNTQCGSVNQCPLSSSRWEVICSYAGDFSVIHVVLLHPSVIFLGTKQKIVCLGFAQELSNHFVMLILYVLIITILGYHFGMPYGHVVESWNLLLEHNIQKHSVLYAN